MSPRKSRFSNPFLFTPLPVTIITSLIYAGLIVGLLLVHLVIPSAPTNPTPVKGVNTTEAWRDLQELTNGYRPYNSRRNDEVRDWLLRRIAAILDHNNVGYSTEGLQVSTSRPYTRAGGYTHSWNATTSPVVIFNDMVSNVSFSSGGVATSSGQDKKPGTSVYFEGTNIIVYVRGSEDDEGDWWKATPFQARKMKAKGGVLINAHYDSVSTGFGASDDGIGVVTILQLIKHFTTSGNKPKKGIVTLLNNGEEDFLNGARAYTQHPISQFAHTFLNLEGAGAGGRATLFRSTDTEVTKAYAKSRYPFGTVISGDGFKRGLVRSQTDYIVFNGVLGLRGLDVAFMEPRARYHTDQDDIRHASIDSLWHMLSAALATVESLSSDTGSTFDGKIDKRQRATGKVNSGEGTDGVWFDVFGVAMAVFRLKTLYALSLTLLVATPLILLVVGLSLHRKKKMYLFSIKAYQHSSPDDDPISLKGLRGFTRYPVAFVLASAAVIGLAFLITKANPEIIYSSQYAVWSMMLTAWLAVAWFVLSGADFVRPSALHRAYSLLWMYIGGWVVLLAVTVAQDRLKIAGGYFMMFYFAGIFLALLISFLEFFALPTKPDYAAHTTGDDEHGVPDSPRPGSSASARRLASSADEISGVEEDQENPEHDEATETTSLLQGDRNTTFANYTRKGRHSHEESPEHHAVEDIPKSRAYGEEQAWSESLPRWTWLLQFIILAPIVIILVGQVGLLLTSAMYQTGADGSSEFLVYIAIAIFSILILAPLGPFLHRFTYHIPTFFFLIFVGTLIYNMVAFPFSANNRLKVYFIQTVDLETGLNQVSLTGIDGYIKDIVRTLPSASGQLINCTKDDRGKAGLTKCSWKGLAPHVVQDHISSGVPPELGYGDWLHYNISKTEGKNEARFQLSGRDTRACKLVFHAPISNFSVVGAGTDERFEKVPKSGSSEIRLWSREWERPWQVDVQWSVGEGKSEAEQGIDGNVVCLWSDNNYSGVIPALDEVRRFAPDWVAVTKLADGLVEGKKSFMV
ncbi:MAG: hypothetical protein M1812_002733 [Candelaria pacifica]|nr:MAG: hypothetical protein M1812_002733 [Candelaria pacifica]